MSDRFDHKLEHTLESKPVEADAGAGSVRRIELITGTGRRRHWSSDDKVRIVVESFEGGATVSEVARRHGLSPQQLFAWRREARTMSLAGIFGVSFYCRTALAISSQPVRSLTCFAVTPRN